MLDQLLGEPYFNKNNFSTFVWEKAPGSMGKYNFKAVILLVVRSFRESTEGPVTPFIAIINKKEIVVSNSDEFFKLLNDNLDLLVSIILKELPRQNSFKPNPLVNQVLNDFKTDPDVTKLLKFWTSL